MKKLEELGLKISFKASGGKLVIGSIDVKKLLELVKIPQVRLVEPLPVA